MGDAAAEWLGCWQREHPADSWLLDFGPGVEVRQRWKFRGGEWPDMLAVLLWGWGWEDCWIGCEGIVSHPPAIACWRGSCSGSRRGRKAFPIRKRYWHGSV